MPKRHIRAISAAVAVALPLGAAVCGAVAVPAAQAQTVKVSPAKAKPANTKPVVGVNLYVDENYPLKDVEKWGARDLKYIHDTLRLKAVAIDWDYEVPTRDANIVEDSPARTPTIGDIKALTKIAKSYGMRVEYRALFAIDGKDTRDGSINPTNFDAWIDWLYTTEKPALKLAGEEKVQEFVVGTEMEAINQKAKLKLWDEFFKKAAKIYKGSLSYANWGGHTANQGFFSKGRVELPTAELGATGYPAIGLAKGASVGELTKAWEKYLTDHTSETILRRTAIDEIGIPALAGAYDDPWQWNNLRGTADATVQARWFKAACDAVTAEHLRGIYFWSEPIEDNPAKPYGALVSFLGRSQSLAAIKSC